MGRCRHYSWCSRVRGEDMTITDVTIKTQIGNNSGDVNDVMPGSEGLGFFGILNKSSELRFRFRRSKLIFRTWARPVQFVDCGVRTRVDWVSELRIDDGRTISIEKVCLSLLESKNLNLKKVINVSYLNKRVVSVSCFSDSDAYEHSMKHYERFMHMYISRIRRL